MLQQQKVGVIGMGTMGQNLALNLESRGYDVSIYNRSRDKINTFITNNLKKNFTPYYSIKEFVLSLNKPRFIFLMITAGVYVDNVIQVLIPYLDIGDILIDGGNSFYKDTIRRNIVLSKEGIDFIGIGISGGEEGALKGPSLMPGGQRKAYNIIKPVLKNIAARIDNEICVSYIGPDGSGHYVKMIHNGIEYGDMQLIAEIYFLLKKIFHLTHQELGEIFNQWNQGELNSYLIEITSHILMKEDNNNCCILNYILDVAENKGTGTWASQSAFDLGVPSNIMVESVFARYLSMFKNQRVQASKIFLGPDYRCSINNELFIEKARKALYLSKIILHAQGFYQLKVASDKYCWNLNFKEISRIFLAGCIIRSKFLKKITDIYSQTSEFSNLLLTPYCVTIANNYQDMLRDVVIHGVQNGISMPALSSAMAYYDAYRSAVLPSASLIQAQRDFFGAHTYMRIDRKGVFHTEWTHK